MILADMAVGVADAIQDRRTQGHHCIAPLCPQTATHAILVSRLCHVGGRWRHPGDWLDTCAEHARQVYSAHSAATYSQLPVWLRPHLAEGQTQPTPGRFLGVW